MSQPAVKASDIKRYFNRTPNYTIEYEGGDLFIKQLPLKTGERGKKIVRIGHRFASHLSAEIPSGIIKKIERTFGITRQDLLSS